MNVVQPIRGEKGAIAHRNSLGNETIAMSNQVTSASPVISFPVGYHDLHPDISINFQLNRFYGWVGDDSMLTEMRETLAGVKEATDYPMFTRLVLDLGEKARARHEVRKGAYYLRLAEFFLFFSDPRKLPTRQRFVDLLLDHLENCAVCI